MSPLRILLAASASVALMGGAMAQTTTTTPTTDGSTRVPVEAPSDTLDASSDEVGEATTVDASTVVELDDDFVLPTLNLPIDALDDYDLEDRDGNDIGEIEEVIGPDESTATAIVVEFDGPGWFFNDEDVERVVDIGKFSIQGEKLIIDISQDDVIKLPIYQD